MDAGPQRDGLTALLTAKVTSPTAESSNKKQTKMSVQKAGGKSRRITPTQPHSVSDL